MLTRYGVRHLDSNARETVKVGPMTIVELLKDCGRALLDALFPRRQALARLRVKWGKPGDKAHSGIGRYFDLTRDASTGDVVDDQTWTDLEFPRLFHPWLARRIRGWNAIIGPSRLPVPA